MAFIVGYSYDFYKTTITTVPIVVPPLLVIPTILVVNCVCGCVQKSFEKVLHRMVDMFSSGEEKKHYLELQGVEKPSKFILFLLSLKAVILLMFSLAVFLNESIIASQTGCISGNWDCFTLSNGQATTITNCSDLGQFSDNSIQCYHPAFQYSTAISEVGGIAFIVNLVITGYIIMFFSVRFLHSRCLRITIGTLIVFFFFVIAFVCPITFAAVHVTLRSTETLQYQMHNIIFGIYYPLLYLVVTLAMIIRSKCTFDDYDPDYDPNTTVITVGGPTGEYGTVGGVTTPPCASIEIAQGNKVHKINVIN